MACENETIKKNKIQKEKAALVNEPNERAQNG